MAFSDARNERDRAETGRNSNNHGGRDNAGAERRNREAMARNGPRASGMSSAAADHLVAMGRISTPSIPAGGVAKGNYPTQDAAYGDFARAVGKHATRGWFDKALDWGLGGLYDPQEPMGGNPRSFAGGDFHSTTNPGSLIGGALGMVGGPAGAVLGKIAGPAYTAAGLPEIWHGGYDQPDLRNGPFGNTANPMGSSMADLGSGHTYPSGGGPAIAGGRPMLGGGIGNGGQWSGMTTNPNQGVQSVSPAGQAAPAASAGFPPNMAQSMLPPATLGGPIPGLQNYGLNLPGYGYFGQPGQTRPQSAMLGQPAMRSPRAMMFR